MSAFDWGNKNKDGGGSSNLPRHIERMNKGTEKPQMKNGDGGNLPWGGKPAEQSKAYMSGLPKNKGSMVSKTGERKSTAMPNSGKAHSGHDVTIKAKAQPIKGKGKK